MEQLVNNFIRLNAEKIFSEATITILTQPQLIKMLALEGLSLTELNKFHAALIWTKVHMRDKCIRETLQTVFAPFLGYLRLTKIPIKSLVEDVRRSKVVPERLLAHACAHNEMKERFAAGSGRSDDYLTLPLKKDYGSAKFQSPFIVGIASATRYLSDPAMNGKASHQYDKHAKHHRRLKTARNHYDVAQIRNTTNSPKSQLTRASKISSSSPCLDLMF